MIILDGKQTANIILEEIKNKIKINNYKISMAIIMIGNNEASEIYVKNKIKKCLEIGMNYNLHRLEENIPTKEVEKLIKILNEDNLVHGIIIQSPLPKHLDFNYLSGLINANKDIDGLGKDNIYKNYSDNNPIYPCTVIGIIKLLEQYNIDINGKDITIIGKGLLVGKPLAIALINRGATVTVCHSKTKDLISKCQNADIIISATGQKGLVNEKHIKENQVLIDVGITRDGNTIKGDIDYSNIKSETIFYTPVPGGIGPMTVAMLLSNTLEAYERINNE